MSTNATPAPSGLIKFGGSLSKNRRWALIASYASLVVFAIFFLFPVYYMLVTSFKTNEEISSLEGSPWIINQAPTLHHSANLFQNTSFPTYFINTVIVTLLVVAITMVVSVLAAYSRHACDFSARGCWRPGFS